jgi:nucleoside-diphosphate-sugar epimerase
MSTIREDASINILGTLNILEALKKSGGTKTRVAFSSTGGAIYGDLVKPPIAKSRRKTLITSVRDREVVVEHFLAYYRRVHKFVRSPSASATCTDRVRIRMAKPA